MTISDKSTRKGSFAEFAAENLLSNNQRSKSLEREIHSALLLGFSLKQSFVVLLGLLFFSTLELTELNKYGVPVLNEWKVLEYFGMYGSMFLFACVWAFNSQTTHTKCGGKKFQCV